MSAVFKAEYAEGVRWNDPEFNINWPTEVKVISNRDQNFLTFIA